MSHASADNEQLKPVIVALLDAGVRLWFDRPNDLGLEVDRFAGCIPVGQRWSEEILAAIDGAAGMLLFPSEAFRKSTECLWEAAAGSTFLLRRKIYKIIPILLANDSYEHLPHRVKDNQGVRIDTQKEADGAWAMNPASSLRFNTLAESLRRLVVALPQQPPAPTALAVRPPRTFHAPYRIDRVAQRRLVRVAHTELRQAVPPPDRRPIVVVHGQADEALDRFVSVTMVQRLIRNTKQCFNWGAETANVLRPAWPPGDPGEQAGFDLSLLDDLAERFQGAEDLSPGRGLSRADRLAEAFSNNKATRIVASDLSDTLVSAGEFNKNLLAWVQFWNAFPFERSDALMLDATDGRNVASDSSNARDRITVVPVLGVSYEGSSSETVRGARTPSISEQLADKAGIAALTAACTRVQVLVLPALPQVTKTCVDQWMDDDKELFPGGADAASVDPEELKALFQPQPSMPMRRWVDVAAEKLWLAGVGR